MNEKASNNPCLVGPGMAVIVEGSRAEPKRWTLPVSRTPWHICKFGDTIIFANGECAPYILTAEGSLEALVPSVEIKHHVTQREPYSPEGARRRYYKSPDASSAPDASGSAEAWRGF